MGHGLSLLVGQRADDDGVGRQRRLPEAVALRLRCLGRQRPAPDEPLQGGGLVERVGGAAAQRQGGAHAGQRHDERARDDRKDLFAFHAE